MLSQRWQKAGIALYEPLLGSLLAPMRHTVVRLAVPQCLPLGFRVLDCCCGAGGLLSLLSQAMQQAQNIDIDTGHGSCIGVDMDTLMLSQSKKYITTMPVRVPMHITCANAIHLPFASQSIHVATLCMALHTMTRATALRVLREVRRVAYTVVIADYCLAERNISLPSAVLAHTLEMIAGGAHYTNYKAFMQKGALEGLLHEEGWTVRERHTVFGGVGRVVLV